MIIAVMTGMISHLRVNIQVDSDKEQTNDMTISSTSRTLQITAALRWVKQSPHHSTRQCTQEQPENGTYYHQLPLQHQTSTPVYPVWLK